MMATTYTAKARRALNKLRLEQAQIRVEKAKAKLATATSATAQFNAEREYWGAVRDVADYRRKLKKRKKVDKATATARRALAAPIRLIR
jgi:RNA polymerase-interacting CarD/CdnL/TRCF family regulator